MIRYKLTTNFSIKKVIFDEQIGTEYSIQTQSNKIQTSIFAIAEKIW